MSEHQKVSIWCVARVSKGKGVSRAQSELQAKMKLETTLKDRTCELEHIKLIEQLQTKMEEQVKQS